MGYLNWDLIMDKPINQYIQDLMMDTENAAKHFDTKIHIAFAQENISQIKNSNSTNILHKRQLHIIIKQIHRKLIK